MSRNSSTGAPAGSAPVRRRRSSGAEPYDFRRPIKLSREHSRTLQLALEGFARQVTTVYTSVLRTVCQVNLLSIEQKSYSEYVETLAPSTYMTIFTADPIPGHCVWDVPLPAIMASVDHMLGGPGGATQPDRPLSEIEAGLVQRFTERLLSELRYSMTQVAAIEPEITGVEYSPQFAQVAGAAEVVVVASFELKVGTATQTATLCLPFAGLLPFLSAAAGPAALSERERAQRAHIAGRLQMAVQDVPLDVSVRLRHTPMTAAELSSLTIGDVVRLSHPAAAPLNVVVDDATYAYALAGAQGRRLAARVVASADKETK